MSKCGAAAGTVLLLGRSDHSEGKLADDFNKMDAIVKGNMPSYQSTELTIDPKAIEETGFSAGSAYRKAILCLLAYQQPKSFDTNGIVILDNSHLKIATSRNYHHLFSDGVPCHHRPKQKAELDRQHHVDRRLFQPTRHREESA